MSKTYMSETHYMNLILCVLCYALNHFSFMKKEEGMWKQKPLKKQNKKKALKSTKLLLSKSQKRTSSL
jgi:hypothetical protein